MSEQDSPPPPAGISRLLRAYLLVLVTVTGATILALEVLGTRVIGTYYGSSLYVWAALLTVTLVCLAIGYAVGGRLADRLPSPAALFTLVVLAGLSVLGAPSLTGVLEPISLKLGLEWGSIVSALVVFFLPLTLLAMTSPYVIRLRAVRVEGVGSTSGGVYAVATFGSVAGVLLVSMWLLPWLGTTGSLRSCAAALIAAGGIGLALALGGRRRAMGLAVLAAAAAAAALVPLCELPVAGEIYHCESPFGDLRVVQSDASGAWHRMLMVNGIMQTGMPANVGLVAAGSFLRDDRNRYYLELLPYFYPDQAEGRKGVLIGLAGGMFPRVMEHYEIDWTAVEIDVLVAELAAAYFGYRGPITYPDGRVHTVDLSRFPGRDWPAGRSPIAPTPSREPGDEPADGDEPGEAAVEREPALDRPYRGRAVIQDGRQYLATHPGKVDFIVLDAYNSDTIPFHLITREFFELVRSRLTDDGILAINYIGPAGDDFVTDSLFRTLAAVFGPDLIAAYRTNDDPDAVQVITVLAFRQKMAPTYGWRSRGAEAGEDPLDRDLMRRKLDTDRAGGMVVTDDHNPIDLARARTALVWRVQTRSAMRQ